VYARAATPCSATLAVRCSGTARAADHGIGASWRRIAVGGSPGVDGDLVEFAVSIPPGATVELFGLQAEAQPNASAYRCTASRGGSYPLARFDQDTLRIETAGPNNHGTNVRIASPAGD
jgi:hypothetical protein